MAATTEGATTETAVDEDVAAEEAVAEDVVAEDVVAEDDAAKAPATARAPVRDATPDAAATKDDAAQEVAAGTEAPEERPSTAHASDGEGHEPVIPGDVATGMEELPPGFWDGPPAAEPERAKRVRPAQEPARGPAASPGPRRGASRKKPRDGAPGSRSGSELPDAGLERALLGGEATADELPDALHDTVDALLELFPGELLAVTPRADEDDTASGRGADDAGDPDDTSNEDDHEDDHGDTTHDRGDAG